MPRTVLDPYVMEWLRQRYLPPSADETERRRRADEEEFMSLRLMRMRRLNGMRRAGHRP